MKAVGVGKASHVRAGGFYWGMELLLKHYQNWGNDSISKSVQCLLNRYELISRTQVESWVQRHSQGPSPGEVERGGALGHWLADSAESMISGFSE